MEIRQHMIFHNRTHAGKLMAEKLKSLKGTQNLIVLGLPRGGVVVASYVAEALNAKLDVIICRKIGAPGNEEFAIGAISEAGGRFLNQDIIDGYNIKKTYIDDIIAREEAKIKIYQQEFRDGKPLPSFKNKTVILVDDGAATGMTMKAAGDAVRKQNPAKIIIALPVAPQDTAQELETLADEMIILETPPYFQAVGQFYEDFRQIETEEVKELLAELR